MVNVFSMVQLLTGVKNVEKIIMASLDILRKENNMIKLTNRQAMILIHVLQDTLTKNVVGYLSTTQDCRNALLNEIINQQDDKILKLEE